VDLVTLYLVVNQVSLGIILEVLEYLVVARLISYTLTFFIIIYSLCLFLSKLGKVKLAIIFLRTLIRFFFLFRVSL
jgi:hypothetical protein